LEYITAFSLIAVVLIVSALAAGLVDRAPLSFPMIFLAVGFIVGPLGLGVIAVTPQDPILQTLATLSLALVLFLDAVRLRFDSSSTGWVVPVLDLGPGTIITLVCIALSALVLFGVTPLQALLLGTILSSTDPIVLRDIIRDERLPHSVRQALSIEAGTNDMVILPILFVLLAVMHGRQSGLSDWLTFLGALLIVGPLAGALVGGIGSGLMAVVDARFPVRREYQALYGVGLVLGAYVAGVLAGGDGFLSAFAGGLAVTLLNNELCDCFMDYGEVTAEMAMLLTFVLMGALLSDILGSIVLGPALLFAALVIGVARPLAISVVLHGSPISRAAQAFIAWFGPRGLSSLLFALLAVTNGVPEGDQLLATVGVVVIVSVVLHGASATPMSDWYVGRLAASTHAEERDESLLGVAERDTADVPRIEPEELATRMVETPPPILLDVRSRSDYAHDRSHIPGSVRVLPDMVTVWAARQPKERLVVTYCT
jgi:sodium/hydrogen antiporter